MPISIPDANLSSEQFKRKKVIDASPYTHSYQYVNLGDLPSLQQNGYISFDFRYT